MNLISILDFYYSHFVLIFLSFALLFVIFLTLFIKNPFKFTNKKIYIYKTSVIIIFIVLTFTIFRNCGGYGYVKTVKTVSIDEGIVAVLDEKDLDESEVYRIHAIDAKTGKKISRHYLGKYSELYIQNGYNVFIKKGRYYFVMNIKNGKIISSFKPKVIEKNYPEIEYGVDSINFNNNYAFNNQFLQVNGKDGKIYYIKYFEDKLYKTIPTVLTEIREHNFSDTYISKYEKNTNITIFTLEHKSGTNKIKTLKPEDKRIDKNFPDFIEPKFIQIFPEYDRFIILSYETTDKKSFILSTYNYKCDPIWRITQYEQSLEIKSLRKSNFEKSICYYSDIIFNCGGILYSVNVITGKINWRIKL